MSLSKSVIAGIVKNGFPFSRALREGEDIQQKLCAPQRDQLYVMDVLIVARSTNAVVAVEQPRDGTSYTVRSTTERQMSSGRKQATQMWKAQNGSRIYTASTAAAPSLRAKQKQENSGYHYLRNPGAGQYGERSKGKAAGRGVLG
jgi:hypothetical protein